MEGEGEAVAGVVAEEHQRREKLTKRREVEEMVAGVFVSMAPHRGCDRVRRRRRSCRRGTLSGATTAADAGAGRPMTRKKGRRMRA